MENDHGYRSIEIVEPTLLILCSILPTLDVTFKCTLPLRFWVVFVIFPDARNARIIEEEKLQTSLLF